MASWERRPRFVRTAIACGPARPAMVVLLFLTIEHVTEPIEGLLQLAGDGGMAARCAVVAMPHRH